MADQVLQFLVELAEVVPELRDTKHKEQMASVEVAEAVVGREHQEPAEMVWLFLEFLLLNIQEPLQVHQL